MLLFTYGTLRSGYYNNVYLNNANYLGKAITKDLFKMYANGIPFVIDEPYSKIVGDLYEIKDRFDIESIDLLEGHPDNYYREEIPVIYNNTEIIAWMYFYPKHRLLGKTMVVEDGNYESYLTQYFSDWR
jgi:gamma-glutamylcyclotransferase (GGCT)/AIG2-like uncharacterized protein YtfP